MYLEISARGSGKTTRLRDAAREYLAADPKNIAIIVSEKMAHSTLKCRSVNHDRAFDNQRVVPADTMDFWRGVTGAKYFVDDFEEIASGRLRVDINAHYALWAKSVRQSGAQEFVRSLIKANGSTYLSYGPIGDQQEDRRTFGDDLYFEETSLDWETTITGKRAA